MRVHISPQRLRSIHPGAQGEGFKPVGLWYSCGDAWLNYVRTEMPQRARGWATVLDVDMSRMLRLRTARDVMAFDRRYGATRVDDQYDDDVFQLVRWHEVAAKHAGIEFFPFFPSAARKLLWYSRIDVASGCVWDPSAVRIVDEAKVSDLAR